MEEIFEKLKKEGKNSVDGLVKWMKDSKLLGDTQKEENNIRNLFKDTADKSNVEFAKFKEVLANLAAEKKKNLEEMMNSLASNGNAFLESLKSGAVATAASAVGTAKDVAANALAAFGKK